MARSYGRAAPPPSVPGTVRLIPADDVGGAAAGYGHGVTARRLDLLLAAALTAASLAQVLAQPIAARGAGVLVAVASCAPVAFRHARPIAATLAGSVVWLAPTDGYLYLGYVAALLLYFSLATEVGDVRVVGAVAAAGCALGALAVWTHHDVVGELFGSLLIVIAPVAAGRLVRRQREQHRRLEELTLHLERERERGARAAVAEERARIARELHDVVAHGVSVIAIQSDAAEAALARDPSLAGPPLRAIRGSARDALAEMRRLLGFLRSDDDASEMAPQPGLAQLPELVARAGVPVTLEVTGEPRALPAGIDISAYRIVQEALTNVHKHAGAVPTTVRIAWSDGRVELSVRDLGPGVTRAPANGEGHGLIGMRERVRLLGGELRTGPAVGGGFEVRAVLPTDAAPAAFAPRSETSPQGEASP
jgi:signal transduction histidine kinase